MTDRFENEKKIRFQAEVYEYQLEPGVIAMTPSIGARYLTNSLHMPHE